jgi:hypothetical protein
MLLAASAGLAVADSRSDMAAALEAFAELRPAPAVLPALAPTAHVTSTAARIAAPGDAGRHAADQMSEQNPGQGLAVGLARRAQDAAAAAADQMQDNAAKARARGHHN